MTAMTKPFVPDVELTAGQPEPVAANGGKAYTSRDVNGDAGTAAAVSDALKQIASGEGQAVTDVIENAAPGPIETPWGKGFRRYAECQAYIESSDMQAPEGGLALPLHYTIFNAPSYSVVPSNAIWKDPTRKEEAAKLAKDERDNARRSLYFPQIMRDARRISEYYPGLSPNSPECAWTNWDLP